MWQFIKYSLLGVT